MKACPKCGAEIDDMADCCPGCLASVNSLVAAISGDRSGMTKADLILTCEMLERGRAIWRKEAEELRAIVDSLHASIESMRKQLPPPQPVPGCPDPTDSASDYWREKGEFGI